MSDKVNIRRVLGGTISALFFLLPFATVHAQDLLIGQSTDLSGPQSALVKEMNSVVTAYIARVNASGGVGGRKIVIETIDDGFDTKRTVSNARRLITERGVLALFQSRGSANAEALIPVLNEFKIPLIAPVGGSNAMHDASNRYLFNHKPMFRLEAERAILHLATQGMKRVAIIYTDDAFGRDALGGAKAGVQTGRLQVVAEQMVPRGDAKVDEIAAKTAAANPDAVICLGIARTCAALIISMRTAGVKAQMMTLSNTASASYVKALGKHAHGVIVVQAFPSPFSKSNVLARELNELAKTAGFTVSYSTMEGLVTAKLLVESLRRAGPKVSRESLYRTLEGIKRWDLGGFELDFGPNDRTGSTYIDLTMIGRNGNFVR